MTYTPNSSLIKTSGHYSAQQLYAAFEPMIPAGQKERVRRILDRVVVLCTRLNLDEVAVAAIIWIETGAPGTGLPFRSSWYLEGLQLGNIGITGDPAQNAAAQTWSTPEDAVNGLMAHVVAYAYGSGWRSVWDVDEMGQPQAWDKRFDIVLRSYGGARQDTLELLNGRWAWDADNNYHGKLAERANKLVAAMSPPVSTPSTDPEPIPGEGAPMAQPIDLITDYLVEAPVTKQYPGQGYSVGSRTIVGLVEHETQGVMTGPDRQRFFSCPNGERCNDALVDFGIAQNGKIYRFQDPFTTNRIPYASGGSASAITQTARKATAQMGNPAGGVNAIYAAVEIEKNRGAAMNPAQIEATARLLAYICAMNEYPADDWKYPEVLRNNVPTSTNHSDLYTSTNCRINDDDRAKFEARCTELLRAYYANVIPDSDEEEPTTPPPPPEIIPGVDLAIAKRLFGSVKGEDGRTYSYDPNGSVSTLWRDRGVATGMWPRLEEVWSYADGRRYFLFEDGTVILAPKGSDPQWLKQEAA